MHGRDISRSGSFGSRLRFCSIALVVCVLCGPVPPEAAAQEADPPTGTDAFEKMAEYLSRGSGRWRAHIPPRDGGPDALGLWFERTAGGRLLGLTVAIFYGDEVRTGLRGYWFWHPGRREILYNEVTPGGKVRMGTSHFTDSRTFVTLTDSVGPNGELTPNRGVNVLFAEDEHRTTAYALDARGEWIEQQSLTWVRDP